MEWILFIALTSLPLSSTGARVKDVSNVRDGRIMGGKLASEGELPFIVSILCSGMTLHCAGTIIDKEWVLTAAHCVSSCQTGDMTIRSGSTKWTQGGTLHRVLKKIPHPEFGIIVTGEMLNDIGLLKVIPPFLKNRKTESPVHLAKKDYETLIGNKATAAGWGKTWPGMTISQHLRKAVIPIVETSNCPFSHPWPENVLCAGDVKGWNHSCAGDSGGPLLINGTQYGIVSWGIGCENPHISQIYTEVAAYRSWIRKYTNV